MKVRCKALCIGVCLLLSFCLPNNSFAQFFKKGHLVYQDGQIEYGLIKDNTFDALSRSVEFKTDRQSKTIQVFGPHDITGYAFDDGDVFEAHQLHKNQDCSSCNGEFRFLRLVRQGDLTLLELRDNTCAPLFVQKLGGELILLTKASNSSPSFISVLNQLMQDRAIQVSSTSSLSVASLAPYVDAYNHWKSEDEIEKEKATSVTVWGTTGLPLEYKADGFSSFAKGGLIETVMPLSKGKVGVAIGVDHYRGIQMIDQDARLEDPEVKMYIDASLSGRYYFGQSERLTPYVGTGVLVRRQGLAKVYPMGMAGVAFHLKRHHFKVELGMHEQFFGTIGYGFSLWQ